MRPALAAHEWRCGNRLFFNDFVTPYGNAREVVGEVLRVFSVDVATSLRRNQDGTVRRINRWTGASLRRARAEATR